MLDHMLVLRLVADQPMVLGQLLEHVHLDPVVVQVRGQVSNVVDNNADGQPIAEGETLKINYSG